MSMKYSKFGKENWVNKAWCRSLKKFCNDLDHGYTNFLGLQLFF